LDSPIGGVSAGPHVSQSAAAGGEAIPVNLTARLSHLPRLLGIAVALLRPHPSKKEVSEGTALGLPAHGLRSYEPRWEGCGIEARAADGWSFETSGCR
jgi:hypothetical protein